MATRFAVGAALVLGLGFSQFARADDVLEKPVRLKADGKVIDTGKAWGHSSPCIEDLDGDGLADLLLGDFSGKFHVFKNVGQPGKPEYKDAGYLQAGGQDAKVNIYCCVGAQPRFVDLDGDGIRDFISSSYDPGHCYFFRGLTDHKFAKDEELVDKAGVPVRSAPVQQQKWQSFGSFFTPVDWDADGDFDLLIGRFNGELLLRVNEGNAEEASFAAENKPVLAGGEPLKVKAHCCPVVADWDGDGLWDIISGSDDGSVTWFRNAGTKESPVLEKGVTLVEKHDGSGYNLLRWTEEEIVPGIRTQVEVVDYNGDGKLDLLVGDFCTAYHPKKNLDEEAKKQLTELITKGNAAGKAFADKLKALREDFAERYPGDALYSDEATKEWREASLALNNGPEHKEMERGEFGFVRSVRPLLAETHGPGDHSYELAMPHGYVWLFLRK